MMMITRNTEPSRSSTKGSDMEKYGRIFTASDVALMTNSTVEAVEQRAAKLDQEGKLMFSSEPVFVIRAKDRAAVGTIASYADRCKAIGSCADHVIEAERAGTAILAWQAAHPSQTKVAD